MSDASPGATGWFEGLDPDETEAAAEAIRDGPAETPCDWPALAEESGFVGTQREYYDALREATLHAARLAVRERERASNRQLIHAVWGMDDCDRVANELAERVTEWARGLLDNAGEGVEGAREVVDSQDAPETLRGLAARVRDLDEHRRVNHHRPMALTTGIEATMVGETDTQEGGRVTPSHE
jgi:nucleolar protein 56